MTVTVTVTKDKARTDSGDPRQGHYRCRLARAPASGRRRPCWTNSGPLTRHGGLGLRPRPGPGGDSDDGWPGRRRVGLSATCQWALCYLLDCFRECGLEIQRDNERIQTLTRVWRGFEIEFSALVGAGAGARFSSTPAQSPGRARAESLRQQEILPTPRSCRNVRNAEASSRPLPAGFAPLPALIVNRAIQYRSI